MHDTQPHDDNIERGFDPLCFVFWGLALAFDCGLLVSSLVCGCGRDVPRFWLCLWLSLWLISVFLFAIRDGVIKARTTSTANEKRQEGEERVPFEAHILVAYAVGLMSIYGGVFAHKSQYITIHCGCWFRHDESMQKTTF